ncbi:alpha/beta fold hydrolase [Pseudomonas sp. HR96]|uniref:alpha/beta fold hydrolase n=1 Tax=Pseudomonas sp. HR96 TaxID=1027966 RepID=UPI002A757AF1|nr:alpha/beta fold hydrolase [Pseudomonas sp. HR96]WPP00808.1 alpha/beta fold hydrolase [Pseudomonas sp. HR96]
MTPYLLIHGLIGTLRPLLPIFARHGAAAHAPDLLGYGTLQAIDPASITLHAQVEHLLAYLDEQRIDRVHLVGHSVGGAIAMLFAERYPGRVASLVSVEGNFTLDDAFWSAGVARMSPVDAETMLETLRAHPDTWLAKAGIDNTPAHRATALHLLNNQPASTLQATAGSVLQVTGDEGYLHSVRAVLAGPIPVHLLAGKDSRDGWHVPDWALQAASSMTLLPGGHLMMVQDPERFVTTVLARR